MAKIANVSIGEPHGAKKKAQKQAPESFSKATTARRA